MRLAGQPPKNSVWFTSYVANDAFATVGIVDAETCRVTASFMLAFPLFGEAAIVTHPCLGAFYASNSFVGQVLPNGSTVWTLQLSNVRNCVYDSTNNALAVLTGTTISEISPQDGHTIWSQAHGVDLVGIPPNSIDCDRSGNIAFATSGQVRIYNGLNGTLEASASPTGAAYCRFDGQGNLYVGGTSTISTVTAYSPGLASTIWSLPNMPINSLTCGDGGLWIGVSNGNARNTLKLSYTNGSTLATANNVCNACAIPGDQAIGTQLILPGTGPTLCAVDGKGNVGRFGDLWLAFGGISGVLSTFPEWQPNTGYVAGNFVLPDPPNGHSYKAITPIIPGSPTQPIWPTATGATVSGGPSGGTWQEDTTLAATTAASFGEPACGRIGAFKW